MSNNTTVAVAAIIELVKIYQTENDCKAGTALRSLEKAGYIEWLTCFDNDSRVDHRISVGDNHIDFITAPR